MTPLPVELTATHGLAQRSLDRLGVLAVEEGYEVAIHAQFNEAGETRWVVHLLRRIAAPEFQGPALRAVTGDDA